jgi:hypothetical protein
MPGVAAKGTIEGAPVSPRGLYPRLLGAGWDDVDPAVRRAHAEGTVLHAEGVLRVRHGTGRLTRLILCAARVPPPSDAAVVRVSVSRRGPVERWHRTIEGKPLVTVQRAGPGGLLVERLGILELRFRLAVAGGAVTFRQMGLAVRLGRLRLPVPGWLSPRVAAREGPADGPDRTSVAVEVSAPTEGLLFSYQGSVRWRAMP